MTQSIQWKQVDGLHFNGLCTNRFKALPPPPSYGAYAMANCDLCVSPYVESTETPCNEVLLPDPLGVYQLSQMGDCRLAVNYPPFGGGWKEEVIGNWKYATRRLPVTSRLNFRDDSFFELYVYPYNADTYDHGYTHGTTCDEWIARPLTSVGLRPSRPTRFIVPVFDTPVIGGMIHSRCSWSQAVIQELLMPPIMTEIAGTIDDVAAGYTDGNTPDAGMPPTLLGTRLQVETRVLYNWHMQMGAFTPGIGSVDWNSPETEYYVQVYYKVQQHNLAQTLMGRPRVGNGLNPSAISPEPWSYGVEENVNAIWNASVFAGVQLPYLETEGTWRWSTHDRNDFMSRSTFPCTRYGPSWGHGLGVLVSDPSNPTPVVVNNTGRITASYFHERTSYPFGLPPIVTPGGWCTLADAGFGDLLSFQFVANDLAQWPQVVNLKRTRIA